VADYGCLKALAAATQSADEEDTPPPFGIELVRTASVRNDDPVLYFKRVADSRLQTADII
jgi:hypothetical protein